MPQFHFSPFFPSQPILLPGLAPYAGLNRPEPKLPPPPPPRPVASASRGRAAEDPLAAAEVAVETPVQFGRRKTSRTTRSLDSFSVRPRAPPRQEIYDQGGARAFPVPTRFALTQVFVISPFPHSDFSFIFTQHCSSEIIEKVPRQRGCKQCDVVLIL